MSESYRHYKLDSDGYKEPHPHSSLRMRRDVLPHIVLRTLARDSLACAEAAERLKQQYWCVGAITFAALAVEAALNLLGSLRVARWKHVESSASAEGKLAVLEALLGMHIEHDRPPFSDFRTLFRFRNLIVHAKPESLPVVFEPVPDSDVPHSVADTPLAKWEKRANLAEASRLVSSAEAIIDALFADSNVEEPLDGHELTRVWTEKGRPPR